MTGDQQLMSEARRPYQMSPADLATHLEEMVMVTFEDLTGQFMLVPRGSAFVTYEEFAPHNGP